MDSSSGTSLRKSFGNIIGKITSKPSLEGNPQEIKQTKISNIPCYICGEKSKKNIQCRHCGKVTCLLDSGVIAIGMTERTCDVCIRENITNNFSGAEAQKDQLGSEIQNLVSQRDTNTKLLNKESARVRGLQNEMKEKTDKLENEKRELMEELNRVRERNKKRKIAINDLSAESSKVKAMNDKEIGSQGEIKKETEHLQIAVDEMVKDRTNLISSLNEVRDFIRMQVPVRIIKKIVCPKCAMAVQNNFAIKFKGVAPVKVESMASPQREKRGACASCGVF